MSLHQQGQHQPRKAHEQDLFVKALSGMNLLYFHPMLPVFKCTRMPDDYPRGFEQHFAAGSIPNTASYEERGWCYFEASGAGLCKDFDFVLDLGHDSGESNDLRTVVHECSEGGRRPAE